MAVINSDNFKVKTIRDGQPRPFADSEYEYEIVSDCDEAAVKEFCTKVLRPNSQERKDWNIGNAVSYFKGYHTFKKTGENTYRYYVRIPFAD